MEDLKARVATVEKRVNGIHDRVLSLEAVKEDGAPGPRVKLFVSEVIAPIQRSVDKIESAMTKLAEMQGEQRQAQEEFYASYQASLDADQKRKEEDQRRKEEEAKSKTVGATVLRWGAIAAAVSAIVLLLRIVGTLLEVYIQTHPIK